MITLLAGLTLAAAPASPPQPCAEQSGCFQATAAQLFALADQVYAQGNKAEAAQVLEGLTRDKHPELRAEARFRLAAVRESMGDLGGAAQVLRELLAEQPAANRARLELARLLGRLGKAEDARAELARAEQLGLPPEVEQNVRRFSATLSSERRRGLTLELTAGPDTNINRSTSSQFIDTIIAPFQLDADARQQAGAGLSGSARGYSRDRIRGVEILSDAAIRADLYNEPRFNDVQLSFDSGPEFGRRGIKLRPSALYERRWFGSRLFSTGIGGKVNATAALSARSQLALSASRLKQKIVRNAGQEGWRTFVGADLTHAASGTMLARMSLRYGRINARAAPERLRQLGGGVLLARTARPLTLFVELDYTNTHGVAPIFLFGKTRRDSRWDVTAGAILSGAKLGGFSPLLRVTHTESDANIVLFDYRRTRLDFGVTRSF